MTTQPSELAGDSLCAVILAAGKGTRMKSEKAKVLHRVFGQPMACHVVEAVRQAGVSEIIVVTGHQRDEVEASLSPLRVRYAYQSEQLGTGHAVRCAKEAVEAGVKDILILCGDTPLIASATLAGMVATHRDRQAVLTVMTTVLENPANYGRVVTGKQGEVLRIVEEKDATEAERLVKEVNAGIYLVNRDFLFSALEQVGTDNKQGEVYLTDIVAIAAETGLQPSRFICEKPDEILGINSRLELSVAEKKLQRRYNDELMRQGVTIQDPDSVYAGREVRVGRDTFLGANLHLRGKCVIGEGCTLDSFSVLEDCVVGNDASIGPFCHLVSQNIVKNQTIPPHTRLLTPEG